MRRLWLAVLWVMAGGLRAAEPPHWQPLGEPGSGGWMTSITVNPHNSRQVLLGGDMLGIGRSEDRGNRWQPTFGLRSYEIGDCTWHPTDANVVWAGTVSGPYLSTDGGRTWSERRVGMPAVSDGRYTCAIEKVLFDPSDARRLLAFGGSSRGWDAPQAWWGTVWESRDGGANWAAVATLPAADKPGNIVGAAFAAGGRRLYAAVRGAGIWASDDSGRSWTACSHGLDNLNVERVVCHPTDPRQLWTCATPTRADGEKLWRAGGVYASSDAGASWRRLAGGLPDQRSEQEHLTTGFKGFAVSARNPRRLVACNTPWDANWVLLSDDGGESWRRVADKSTVDVAYPAGLNLTVMAIDANVPDVIYGAGSEYALRSTDGGRTWTDITAERVGDGWRGRGYSGLCCTSALFDPWVRGRLLLNAMDAGKLWESRDNGSSWRYRGDDPWPWGGGNQTALAKDGHGYCATGQFGGNGGILRTVDGTTWKAVYGADHGLPSKDGGGVAESVYTLPDDSSRVWCCWGGKLYASRDGGGLWAAVEGVTDAHYLAADPKRPTRFLVSGGGDCYLTDDGETFRPIGGPRWAGMASADTLGRFYVCAWRSDKRAGLWRYADGQWTRLWDNYYVRRVAADPSDPRRLVAVDMDHPYHDHVKAQGVWLSTDDGAGWTRANDGLPGLRVEALAINPHDPEDIVIGTHGLGFYRARWAKDYVPAPEVRYAATEADRAFARPADPGQDEDSPFGFRNGDMTQGDALPAGWDGKWGQCSPARDTKVFHSAPASLRVDGTGGSGQAFQLLQVKGGSRLRLSGWLRTTGAKAQVVLQSFDAGFTRNDLQQVRYVQGDSDWSAFSKEVTLPDWVTQTTVQVLIDGQGSCWLDDVKLTRLGAPGATREAKPIALRNADMSAGAEQPTGWDSTWGAAKAFRDTAVFHSAPASLRVETGGGSGQAFQMVDGAYGGAKVKVGGWLKTAGEVKAQVAVQAFAAGFGQNRFMQARYMQGASDWTRFEATVDLPEWTAQFNIQLMVDGPGQAWLDDVSAETVIAGTAALTPDKQPRVAWEPHEGYFPDYPLAWRQRHAGFCERAKQGGIDLLFFGDSLTQGWDPALWKEHFEPRHAANFGIGGDRTDQILWRIANGEVDGLSPKLVVLMIGVNNLWPGDKDVDIARGREAIVKRLRAKLPDSRLLLLGALPAIDDHENGLRGTLARANRLTAALADAQHVFWLDLSPAYLQPDGKLRAELFVGDRLHLSAAGYRVLADGLEPVVARLMR